jgi:hypothetical protein
MENIKSYDEFLNEEIDFKKLGRGAVAAGISLSTLLGSPDSVKASMSPSLSTVSNSISKSSAKSIIEKVVKGFEKQGYTIDYLETTKYQNFEGATRDDIKIEVINATIGSAARSVMNQFIRVNKLDRNKTLFMTNPNENKWVVIYVKNDFNKPFESERKLTRRERKKLDQSWLVPAKYRKGINNYGEIKENIDPIEYSGGDVTKMPVIGKVITKPIGPFGPAEYDIVEVIESRGHKIYVANFWYKEWKKIPQLIHSELVSEWIPK